MQREAERALYGIPPEEQPEQKAACRDESLRGRPNAVLILVSL